MLGIDLFNRTMRTWVLVSILLVTLLGGACNRAESDMDENIKEECDMLDIKSVPYATEFANYQKNSRVPVATGAGGSILWARQYTPTDICPVPVPSALYVGGGHIGIRMTGELAFYDLNGEFKRSVTTGLGIPVVFGSSAVAYTRPSFLLEYSNYAGKLELELKSFPGLQDWTELLLFCPTSEEVLAAFQFTGGPGHSPREYTVYRLPMETVLPEWTLNEKGTIEHALLSPDGEVIYVGRGAEILRLRSDDGTQQGNFSSGLTPLAAMSVSPEGNLVMIGTQVIEEDDQTREQPILQVMDGEGKPLWSADLTSPRVNQPPACGGDGRVFVIDSMMLTCFAAGEKQWEYELTYAQEPWLTVTADDQVICLDNNEVTLLGAGGEEIFSVIITEEPEAFHLPVALNGAGQLLIAGDKKLYCLN